MTPNADKRKSSLHSKPTSERIISLYELPLNLRAAICADFEADLREIFRAHRAKLGITEKPFTVVVNRLLFTLVQELGGGSARSVRVIRTNKGAPLLREPTVKTGLTLPELPRRVTAELGKALTDIAGEYAPRLEMTDKPFSITINKCVLSLIQES